MVIAAIEEENFSIGAAERPSRSHPAEASSHNDNSLWSHAFIRAVAMSDFRTQPQQAEQQAVTFRRQGIDGAAAGLLQHSRGDPLA